MKKYKLIKTFPGSPELGTIEEVEHCFKNLMMGSNGKCLYNISESPEFWELIVEKDYEILTVNPTENHKVYNDKSKIVFWSVCNKDFEYWKIHSVKRLSDSEIFTIGDNTTFGCIDEFYIKHDKLLFTTVLDPCGKNISTANKIKTPLFKTEDGVDIFEGDSYYAINTTFFNNYGSQKAFDKKSPDLTPFWQSNKSVCKYFSTKEKAEDYIINNKPCLSFNDIENIIYENSTLVRRSKLKNLVKTKLKND